MSVFVGIVNMLDECICRHCKYARCVFVFVGVFVNMLDECICRHCKYAR